LSGRGEAFLPGSGWNLTPKRLAGLDKLRVISIVAGDWHFAALTADGDMYTWGQNDWGQCGVSNDGSKVTTPRKVVFPPDGKRPAFVFAITAAGHHSGALVLGHPRGKNELPPIKRPKHKPARGGDDEHGDEGEGSEQTQNVPLFSMPRFRIGFAGRGMRRNPGRTARPG
jgi:SCF-associated factor 1